MGYSRYVGRIGALAGALGVGSILSVQTGVAWAAPKGPSEPSSVSADTGKKGKPADAPSASGDAPTDMGHKTTDAGGGSGAANRPSPSSSTGEATPAVAASSSDGVPKSGETNDRGEAVKKKTLKPSSRTQSLTGKKSVVPASSTTSQTNTVRAAEDNTVTTVKTNAPVTTAAASVDVTPKTLAAAEPAVAKAAPSSVALASNSVAQPILSSVLGEIPGTPTESPLAWVFLAAARRQVGQVEEPAVEASTFAVTTSLVDNQPPTVAATFDTPVASTGAVSGQVVGTDPEGQALTYALTTPPTVGTVVFDSATAKFTYTPTASQRIAAGMTSGVDTVAMTVTVSDGATGAPAVIDIPVSEVQIGKAAEVGAVDDAHAVVATATRAYVSNRSAGTVTVIDTTTNTVIGTIAVGPTPDAMTIKPDGSKLFVTSMDNNTVKVVDTKTNAVTATIAIAKPSAIAINSSGSIVYVTSRDAGTVTKITTATNAISGTVTLPAGSLPTGIVVSPDKTKIYVISNKASGGGTVAVFGYLSSTVTTVANLPSAPTSLAVSPDDDRLYVTSADGKVTTFNTTTRAVLATYTVAGVPAGVTVSNDGSVLMVTDTVGRVTALDAATGTVLQTFATRTSTSAMSIPPGTVASPDGTKLYVTDYDADKIYVVGMMPPNRPPTAGTPTVTSTNAATGSVVGTVGVTDPDKDALTYTVTAAPTKGTLSVKADGTYTYTPTATARHAASTVGAQSPLTTDSFTVSVSDGRGGVVATSIPVNILPANKIPVPTKIVGTPNATTGIVSGKIYANDGDGDAATFTAAGDPSKGSVVVTSTGSFTYTPTATARHAAAKLDATTAEKTDTFTVTVNDAHGGVVITTVTVAISPTNSAPTGATVGSLVTDLNSGVVTGTITATDPNNDTLSYTANPTKGALVFGSNGAFTYTPTEAARQAAAAPDANAATRTDAVTVTVADGYGGTTTVPLNLSVIPYGASAPTNGHATVGIPNEAIGEVKGTLLADDAQDDDLTYALAAAPNRGVVNIDPSGTFRYVPNVEARWGAQTTSYVDTDSFEVTVSDGNGGSTTFTVTVPIAPPSTSASAIDQRGTTVAMNVQEMYFMSQADTDRALNLLKADGVDTIRIMIPWAGVEASDDVWTWSDVDRMVDSAVARDMQVQAFLNSPPQWAAEPGTPLYGGPPADLQEYAEFVNMVATRYAGKVSAYEVWNEPNYSLFWEPTPDAAEYTALLKVAYTAIKAADPNAVVVGGVIAAAPDSGTKAVNSVRFLTEMYEAGAAGYFDALSYHPYHYYIKFSQGGPYPNSPLTMANELHDVMVANGDGNKKIWATEYGEPSKLGSEKIQAAYIDDFLRAWRDLDYAGPAFIHTVHDYATADPAAASLGIYRLNWTPKPAVGVIETIIDENEAFLAGGGGIEVPDPPLDDVDL